MAPRVVLLKDDPLVRFGQILLLKDWGSRVVAETSLKAVNADSKGRKRWKWPHPRRPQERGHTPNAAAPQGQLFSVPVRAIDLTASNKARRTVSGIM